MSSVSVEYIGRVEEVSLVVTGVERSQTEGEIAEAVELRTIGYEMEQTALATIDGPITVTFKNRSLLKSASKFIIKAAHLRSGPTYRKRCWYTYKDADEMQDTAVSLLTRSLLAAARAEIDNRHAETSYLSGSAEDAVEEFISMIREELCNNNVHEELKELNSEKKARQRYRKRNRKSVTIN